MLAGNILKTCLKEVWRYPAFKFPVTENSTTGVVRKTERLISAALSLKIELPLPPISSESSSASSPAASQPQIKTKSAQTDDESQMFSMADVDQPPTKRLKLQCKQFEDSIMGVDPSDLQINMAQNLLKAQFLQLNGLKSTLQQTKSTDLLPVDEVKNKLQIIHCKARHHWIVATTMKCTNNQMLIVDSIQFNG